MATTAVQTAPTPVLSTAETVPLRTALRAATAAAHTELDRTLGHWLSQASPATYTSFLRASLEVVEPLERGLAHWLPAFAAGDRAVALRADLDALDAMPRRDQVESVAAFQDLASARGAAYVLEGSRLGGKVLARLLAAQLAPQSDCFAYLRGSVGDPADRWRRFLDELDTWGAQAGPAACASACTSALATFHAYTHAFTGKGLMPCP